MRLENERIIKEVKEALKHINNAVRICNASKDEVLQRDAPALEIVTHMLDSSLMSIELSEQLSKQKTKDKLRVVK